METEKLSELENDFRKGKIECIGGPIPLERVKSWTANYRKSSEKATTSHLFGRDVIMKILNQKHCAGIRIHYAVDEKGHKQLILSGVDRIGRDQLPNKKSMLKEGIENQTILSQAAEDDESNGNQLYDQSWPCPETRGCPGHV